MKSMFRCDPRRDKTARYGMRGKVISQKNTRHFSIPRYFNQVRADAEAQGLDPIVAERTYRAMIAAFEDYERAEWTRRQGDQPAK